MNRHACTGKHEVKTEDGEINQLLSRHTLKR